MCSLPQHHMSAGSDTHTHTQFGTWSFAQSPLQPPSSPAVALKSGAWLPTSGAAALTTTALRLWLCCWCWCCSVRVVVRLMTERVRHFYLSLLQVNTKRRRRRRTERARHARRARRAASASYPIASLLLSSSSSSFPRTAQGPNAGPSSRTNAAAIHCHRIRWPIGVGEPGSSAVAGAVGASTHAMISSLPPPLLIAQSPTVRSTTGTRRVEGRFICTHRPATRATAERDTVATRAPLVAKALRVAAARIEAAILLECVVGVFGNETARRKVDRSRWWGARLIGCLEEDAPPPPPPPRRRHSASAPPRG